MTVKKYCIIKTSFAKKDHAENMAKILLDKKLAACIQISKANSFYIWNDKIVKDQEFLLSIKTHIDNYYKIEKMIKANHQYQIPEIIVIPIIKGSDDYYNWMAKIL